jgi:hypothetical protein
MKSTSNIPDNNLSKLSNEDSINNFSSLDYVNLKIASKPVKFYCRDLELEEASWLDWKQNFFWETLLSQKYFQIHLFIYSFFDVSQTEGVLK